MKRFLMALVLMLSFCAIVSARPDSSSSNGKNTDPVDEAIAKGIEYLKNSQASNGSWKSCQGTTALALLAIIQNGAPSDCQETIDKAVEFLLARPKYNRVYESACLAMVLQELDPKKYKSQIAKCAEFLGSSQLPTGMWTYGAIPQERWDNLKAQFDVQQASIALPGNSTNNNPLPPSLSPGDNSNTQFALLGLRAARRAGIDVNMDAVRACQDHFMRTQNEDNGWGYTQYRCKSRGSMTCAGIGSLCILDDELQAGSYFTRRKIRKNNVAKGIQWMRDNFSVTTNPGYGRHYLYYMYSMERAASLSGHKQFGDHNWYAESWPVLCESQNSNGSWSGPRFGRASIYSDTAFTILFLKKAQRYHAVKPLDTSSQPNK